jgi:hypothetical protein
MDIITADGGFDFLSISIIRDKHDGVAFRSVSYGLCIQKKNGTFIIKYLTRFSIP